MTPPTKVSAPTTSSARLSQWPRFQLITANTSAASPPSATAKNAGVLDDLQTIVALGLGALPRLRHEHGAARRDHFVAGQHDLHARLAILADEDLSGRRRRWSSRCARRASSGPRCAAAMRAGSRPNCSRTARCASASAASRVEVGAGGAFRQPMPDLPDLAVADHGDPPFLGPVGDVAVEAGKAHLPQWRRQRVAGQRAIGVGTRLAPDEALRQALAGARRPRPDAGEAPPFRAERDAAFAKRGNGRGLGARAVDAQRRHVRRERACRQARRAKPARPSHGNARCSSAARAPTGSARCALDRPGGRGRRRAATRRSTARRAVRATHPACQRRTPTTVSGIAAAAITSAALDPCARRVDQEQRNRKQRQIEERMQQDRRQQPEAQEDERPQRSPAAAVRPAANTPEGPDSWRARRRTPPPAAPPQRRSSACAGRNARQAARPSRAGSRGTRIPP